MTNREIELETGAAWTKATTASERFASAFNIAVTRLVSLLCTGLGSVFFIQLPWISALLWLAFAQNIRHAAFAVVGLIVADALSFILHLNGTNRHEAVLRANAVLTAIAVSWLTSHAGISLPAQLGLSVFVVVAVVIISAAIIRAVSGTTLPPLVWGYCLVAGIVLTLFPSWASHAAQAIPSFAWPDTLTGWIGMFFQSLGTMIYSPMPLAGGVIALCILLWSRTMLIMGVVGWVSGVGTAYALKNLGVEYYYLLSAHNYFAAGMVVGSIIFLPGRWSVLLAMTAGAGASLLAATFQHLFQGSGFAFLPIPSLLTVWIGVGAMSFAADKNNILRNFLYQLPPEEAWWRTSYWSKRSGYPEPLLCVPVAGEVEISQSFDGDYSHVGPWRHALDFQRPYSGPAGTPYAETTWGTTILAPAAGVVENVSDNTHDNQIGVCNYAENWGNYILIRLDQGGWALLAHCRQGSIAVATGTRVEVGTYLGEVGNSGRSPIPHLHVHVQNSPELGAPTVPFRLANYLTRTSFDSPFFNWNSSSVPVEGTVLRSSQPNPGVYPILGSFAPGSAIWHVHVEGNVPGKFGAVQSGAIVKIRVSLDEAGRFIYEDNNSNSLIISLDADAWRIVECSLKNSLFLRLMALANMSIPHSVTTGMSWKEPLLLVPDGPLSWIRLAAAPYQQDPFSESICECVAEPSLEHSALVLQTKFPSQHSSLPVKITSHFEILRGVVKLQAEFEKGTITYSLKSFEPAVAILH